jgi:7-cyano-7-deazaguanine synthase
LAIAIAEGFEPHCISFQYGQRHSIELEKSKDLARKYRCSHHVFEIPKIHGSTLTDGSIPLAPSLNVRANSLTPSGEEVGGGIPATYVPARNTIFLSFALSYAESIGAADIFIGVNALDYSGYPDCRPEYIDSFQKMANLATKAGVEGNTTKIHTPLISLTKAQIIQKGIELGVDYSLTSSCYDPDIFGRACGTCDSCRLRLKGFAEAGITDPIKYQ